MSKLIRALIYLLISSSFIACNHNNGKTTVTNSDSNLINEVRLHIKSSYEGDYDQFVQSISPLLFEYMIKSDVKGKIKSIDDVLVSLRENIDETQQAIINRNLKFEYEIGEVGRTIESAPYLIKTVKVKSIMTENEIEYPIYDEIIAITEDDGLNWEFLTNGDDELIVEVLSLRFDDETIMKILGVQELKNRNSNDYTSLNDEIIKSHTYENTVVTYKNFNTNEEKVMKDHQGIIISKLKNGYFKIKDVSNEILIKYSHIEEDVVYVYEIVYPDDPNFEYSRVKANKDFNDICNGSAGNYSIDAEKSADVWIYKLQNSKY